MALYSVSAIKAELGVRMESRSTGPAVIQSARLRALTPYPLICLTDLWGVFSPVFTCLFLSLFISSNPFSSTCLLCWILSHWLLFTAFPVLQPMVETARGCLTGLRAVSPSLKAAVHSKDGATWHDDECGLTQIIWRNVVPESFYLVHVLRVSPRRWIRKKNQTIWLWCGLSSLSCSVKPRFFQCRLFPLKRRSSQQQMEVCIGTILLYQPLNGQ